MRYLMMIQPIIVKGFDHRTHFIENPNLILKGDTVNIIGKTQIVQELVVKMNTFCHVF